VSLPRFFVPPQHIHGSTLTIDTPQELHHLRHVLRLGVGDQLICFDGEGREYVGTILRSTARRVAVRIDRSSQQPTKGAALWLAQGLPKSGRFEWVIQKATELGVWRLSPLLTCHTVVRLTAEQGRAKQMRWQRIAQEAAKQCRRASLPVIDPPQLLSDVLPAMNPSSLILMPTLAVKTIPIQEALRDCTSLRAIAVLIGPEGDFSRDEVRLAERYGARPVSLGPRVLRTETAAISTLAILQYVLNQ